eukprot:GHVH01002630.1.p1 GENE.GHVH01002630.1~~GHVH01002630.1.p1  ORF type:complete len:2620 (+),score=357.85 GHVH01002630.1:87-7946(+)
MEGGDPLGYRKVEVEFDEVSSAGSETFTITSSSDSNPEDSCDHLFEDTQLISLSDDDSGSHQPSNGPLAVDPWSWISTQSGPSSDEDDDGDGTEELSIHAPPVAGGWGNNASYWNSSKKGYMTTVSLQDSVPLMLVSQDEILRQVTPPTSLTEDYDDPSPYSNVPSDSATGHTILKRVDGLMRRHLIEDFTVIQRDALGLELTHRGISLYWAPSHRHWLGCHFCYSLAIRNDVAFISPGRRPPNHRTGRQLEAFLWHPTAPCLVVVYSDFMFGLEVESSGSPSVLWLMSFTLLDHRKTSHGQRESRRIQSSWLDGFHLAIDGLCDGLLVLYLDEQHCLCDVSKFDISPHDPRWKLSNVIDDGVPLLMQYLSGGGIGDYYLSRIVQMNGPCGPCGHRTDLTRDGDIDKLMNRLDGEASLMPSWVSSHPVIVGDHEVLSNGSNLMNHAALRLFFTDILTSQPVRTVLRTTNEDYLMLIGSTWYRASLLDRQVTELSVAPSSESTRLVRSNRPLMKDLPTIQKLFLTSHPPSPTTPMGRLVLQHCFHASAVETLFNLAIDQFECHESTNRSLYRHGIGTVVSAVVSLGDNELTVVPPPSVPCIHLMSGKLDHTLDHLFPKEIRFITRHSQGLMTWRWMTHEYRVHLFLVDGGEWLPWYCHLWKAFLDDEIHGFVKIPPRSLSEGSYRRIALPSFPDVNVLSAYRFYRDSIELLLFDELTRQHIRCIAEYDVETNVLNATHSQKDHGIQHSLSRPSRPLTKEDTIMISDRTASYREWSSQGDVFSAFWWSEHHFIVLTSGVAIGPLTAVSVHLYELNEQDWPAMSSCWELMVSLKGEPTVSLHIKNHSESLMQFSINLGSDLESEFALSWYTHEQVNHSSSPIFNHDDWAVVVGSHSQLQPKIPILMEATLHRDDVKVDAPLSAADAPGVHQDDSLVFSPEYQSQLESWNPATQRDEGFPVALKHMIKIMKRRMKIFFETISTDDEGRIDELGHPALACCCILYSFMISLQTIEDPNPPGEAMPHLNDDKADGLFQSSDIEISLTDSEEVITVSDGRADTSPTHSPDTLKPPLGIPMNLITPLEILFMASAYESLLLSERPDWIRLVEEEHHSISCWWMWALIACNELETRRKLYYYHRHSISTSFVDSMMSRLDGFITWTGLLEELNTIESISEPLSTTQNSNRLDEGIQIKLRLLGQYRSQGDHRGLILGDQFELLNAVLRVDGYLTVQTLLPSSFEQETVVTTGRTTRLADILNVTLPSHDKFINNTPFALPHAALQWLQRTHSSENDRILDSFLRRWSAMASMEHRHVIRCRLSPTAQLSTKHGPIREFSLLRMMNVALWSSIDMLRQWCGDVAKHQLRSDVTAIFETLLLFALDRNFNAALVLIKQFREKSSEHQAIAHLIESALLHSSRDKALSLAYKARSLGNLTLTVAAFLLANHLIYPTKCDIVEMGSLPMQAIQCALYDMKDINLYFVIMKSFVGCKDPSKYLEDILVTRSEDGRLPIPMMNPWKTDVPSFEENLELASVLGISIPKEIIITEDLTDDPYEFLWRIVARQRSKTDSFSLDVSDPSHTLTSLADSIVSAVSIDDSAAYQRLAHFVHQTSEAFITILSSGDLHREAHSLSVLMEIMRWGALVCYMREVDCVTSSAVPSPFLLVPWWIARPLRSARNRIVPNKDPLFHHCRDYLTTVIMPAALSAQRLNGAPSTHYDIARISTNKFSSLQFVSQHLTHSLTLAPTVVSAWCCNENGCGNKTFDKLFPDFDIMKLQGTLARVIERWGRIAILDVDRLVDSAVQLDSGARAKIVSIFASARVVHQSPSLSDLSVPLRPSASSSQDMLSSPSPLEVPEASHLYFNHHSCLAIVSGSLPILLVVWLLTYTTRLPVGIQMTHSFKLHEMILNWARAGGISPPSVISLNHHDAAARPPSDNADGSSLNKIVSGVSRLFTYPEGSNRNSSGGDTGTSTHFPLHSAHHEDSTANSRYAMKTFALNGWLLTPNEQLSSLSYEVWRGLMRDLEADESTTNSDTSLWSIWGSPTPSGECFGILDCRRLVNLLAVGLLGWNHHERLYARTLGGVLGSLQPLRAVKTLWKLIINELLILSPDCLPTMGGGMHGCNVLQWMKPEGSPQELSLLNEAFRTFLIGPILAEDILHHWGENRMFPALPGTMYQHGDRQTKPTRKALFNLLGIIFARCHPSEAFVPDLCNTPTSRKEDADLRIAILRGRKQSLQLWLAEWLLRSDRQAAMLEADRHDEVTERPTREFVVKSCCHSEVPLLCVLYALPDETQPPESLCYDMRLVIYRVDALDNTELLNSIPLRSRGSNLSQSTALVWKGDTLFLALGLTIRLYRTLSQQESFQQDTIKRSVREIFSRPIDSPVINATLLGKRVLLAFEEKIDCWQVSSTDDVKRLWLHKLTHGWAVMDICVTADGRYLFALNSLRQRTLTSGSDLHLTLLDPQTGEVILHPIAGHARTSKSSHHSMSRAPIPSQHLSLRNHMKKHDLFRIDSHDHQLWIKEQLPSSQANRGRRQSDEVLKSWIFWSDYLDRILIVDNTSKSIYCYYPFSASGGTHRICYLPEAVLNVHFLHNCDLLLRCRSGCFYVPGNQDGCQEAYDGVVVNDAG